MKKLLLAIAFVLLAVPAWGTTHTVTQTGAGADYSVATFNALSSATPGDTYSFSGTITSKIIPGFSGSVLGDVILDGTSATVTYSGDYWGGGLIQVEQKSYLTIQNFTILKSGQASNEYSQAAIHLKAHSATATSHITIDNCDISESTTGIWYWGNVHHITITNNAFHDLFGSGVRGSQYSSYTKPANITVGGSTGNGNTFVNVGYLDSYYNTDAFCHLDQTNNIVISYNYGYSDTVGYGLAGLYLNECTYILIERNIFHTFQSQHHRAPIGLKDDQLASTYQGYVIIRYNHVWNSNGDDESWGDASQGIAISGNWHDVFIYGNYIHNCGVGIEPNITYYGQYDDGYDSYSLYIFSNIISTTQFAGIRLSGTPGTSYDKMTDVRIFNNTIYNTATFDDTLGYTYAAEASWAAYLKDTAILMWLKGAQIERHGYYNNLIIQPRPNTDDYKAMLLRSAAVSSANDYQHYYDAGSAEIKINYWNDSDTQTAYDWDGVTRPGTDGDHDGEGDPALTDMGNGDFRLTSSSTELIDSGTDMGSGNIAIIAIQGVNYEVPWGFALGPSTVFHASDPDSIVIDAQDRNTIGWDIGAYGYLAGGADSTTPVVNITTADPTNITADDLLLSFTCTDVNGISSAKWRIGAAPDATHGTAVSGSSPYTAATSGFSEGANTLHAGCADPTGNYGSDSVIVNLSYTYPPYAGEGLVINGISHAIVNGAARGRNGIGYTYTLPSEDITLTPVPTSWSPACDKGDADVTQNITFTANLGAVTLGAGAAALTTGTIFSITGDACSEEVIAEDGDCVIGLSMDCATIGTPTDTLTVTSNSTDSPTEIALSGAVTCIEDNCPVGTYMFWWGGDYPSDTDKACFTDCDASKNGTPGGTFTLTASYAEFDNENESLTWAISGDDGISDSEGTIFFTVYIDDDGDSSMEDAEMIQVIGDGNNYIRILASTATHKIGALFKGSGGSEQYVLSTGGLDGWYRCGYSWQTGADAGGAHAIICEAGEDAVSAWTTPDDEDTEDLDDWSTQPGSFIVGESSSVGGVTMVETLIRVKDVTVLAGYKTADPGPLTP